MAEIRQIGLDCPELSTPAGKAAKRFVDALVAGSTAVTINTTKPDKYDRYLADVFLELGESPDAQSQAATKRGNGGRDMSTPPRESSVFLNNALLESNHAVRKDTWEFRDWEKEFLT